MIKFSEKTLPAARQGYHAHRQTLTMRWICRNRSHKYPLKIRSPDKAQPAVRWLYVIIIEHVVVYIRSAWSQH